MGTKAEPPAERSAQAPRAANPSDIFSPYARISGRRRLLVLLLAVATASTVILSLLLRPGAVKPPPPPPKPDVMACAKGQTEGCVGSTTRVLMAPAAQAIPATPAAPAAPAPGASAP